MEFLDKIRALPHFREGAFLLALLLILAAWKFGLESVIE